MQQDYHEGGLPLVGRHVIERVDLETGEALPPSVNQKILEGSHSTKLTIRCDATGSELKEIRLVGKGKTISSDSKRSMNV